VVDARLTPVETRALLASAGHVEPWQAMLAAVASAVSAWSRSAVVLVDVYRHGRRPSFATHDLSRTVGLVASVAPELLVLPRGTSAAERRRAADDQLAARQGEPTTYGALRYVLRAPSLVAKPHPELVFNFRGQATTAAAGSHAGGGAFGRLEPSPGAIASPEDDDHYTFRFDCDVLDGAFRLLLGFNRNRHRPETARGLAEQVLGELRERASERRAR
jgi:hypothetical protein